MWGQRGVDHGGSSLIKNAVRGDPVVGDRHAFQHLECRKESMSLNYEPSSELLHLCSHPSRSLSYRGTSLIKKHPPLGPYRRPMPRVPGGSSGGGSDQVVGNRHAFQHLYRGTSPIRTPPTLKSPQVPRHRATVGSCGRGVSCERGTPVHRHGSNMLRTRRGFRKPCPGFSDRAGLYLLIADVTV